ncbi:MAG TPA: metalloregulator ArsR/SmtB family transcription factor [Longimicrobium sp.]|nr:metalloregulator ArsR/SmtB family transcription factor [Longimicrobium sp.]
MKTTTDLSAAARWFHALSDETRLEIVRRLGAGERCVCDLTDALGAAQSRLSFHLKTLKQAGLVSDRKVGRWVYYSLNPEVLDAIAEFATDARPPEEVWRSQDGCCA